jgi:hypothetical protein
MLLQILPCSLSCLSNKFYKIEFIVYQNVFYESCKDACLVHKIIVQYGNIMQSIHMSLYSSGSYYSSKYSFSGSILSKSIKRPSICSTSELNPSSKTQKQRFYLASERSTIYIYIYLFMKGAKTTCMKFHIILKLSFTIHYVVVHKFLWKKITTA